ncbi:MAG: G8 domain-containing protein [Arenicella sp.]
MKKNVITDLIFITLFLVLGFVLFFSSAPQEDTKATEFTANTSDIPAFTLDCATIDSNPLDDQYREFIRIHNKDTVPNFARNFTAKTIKSGQWSDQSIWNNGQVPSTNAIVIIDNDHSVEYDLDSTNALNAVGIAGELRFSDTNTTKMHVTHLLVYRTGSLRIGDIDAPLDATITAEIVINDQRLLTEKSTESSLNNPIDPKQYGNGLLVWGSIDFHGTPKEIVFSRLNKAVSSGDQIIHLDTVPASWLVKDQLLIPDSRQIRPADINTRDESPYNLKGSKGLVMPAHWELAEISKLEASNITLKQTLRYNHKGINTNLDKQTETRLMPHVANVSRNIIIRSENPSGTRGHTIGFHNSSININHALFKDLGRTTIATIDNSIATEGLEAEYIGENQVARYPVHMHHITNAQQLSSSAPSFRLIGNVINGGKRWGLSLHGSHFGLVKNNIVFDIDGAGIVTEDGSETGNVFEGNFVAAIRGSGMDMEHRERGEGVGHEGSGFWLGSDNNIVRNNVVAGVRASGYALFRTERSQAFPEFPLLSDYPDNRIFEFSDNEVYGAAGYGVRIWSTKECSICKSRNVDLVNTLIWKSSNGVMFDYHSDYYTFNKLRIIGEDKNQADTIGIRANHSKSAKVYQATISGMNVGIEAGGVRNRQFNIEDASIEAKTGVRILTPTSWGGKRAFNLDTVKFIEDTSQPQQRFIEFGEETYGTRKPKITQKRPVYVYNHQRIAGNNFQVFKNEQARDYILPQSDDTSMGCPEANMTNAACHEKYTIAAGGQIATCDQTLDGIDGFACPYTN